MSKPTQIHFVTWPTGEVMEGTQTSVAADWAKRAAIRSFLPERWFGALELNMGFGAGRDLWKALEAKGFKAQVVGIPSEVAQGVSR